MLRFVAQCVDGSQFEIKNPLTVVMNSDIDVPADDIAVTVPFDSMLNKAVMLMAFEDESLIFKGNTDEIINIVREKQAVTKITARSLAGMLLDNEAEPVTYVNPSSQFIFNRHLKPFGFADYVADEVPFYGNFKIEKGMTHWQVLENFCRNRYEAVPCITGGGKALFRGYRGDDIVKFGVGGIGYFSLKEDKKPYKLISEVRIRLDEYGEYSGKIVNDSVDCSAVKRMRYVNAAADNRTIKTADNMIALGNKSSYSLALECVGGQIGIMGKRAVVEDKLLSRIENLRVAGIRYILNKNGEVTRVLLRKEKF